ncbi:MAG TPA: hypothetical protein VKG05_15475, partial [Steroidobacteraceae bacterium]|nr:hypothetical protein [Steroidobacteraceae bacterium]
MTSAGRRGVRLCATLVFASGIAGAAQTNLADSLTVPDLLRELSATGLSVLYSSDLVPEGLEVSTPLHGSNPLSRAIEALATHGLELRKTANDRFIVARAARSPPAVDADATAPRRAPATAAAPQLEEVSVFASRYALSESDLGEPYSIAESEIARSPGASDDPLRALRTTPGIATNV